MSDPKRLRRLPPRSHLRERHCACSPSRLMISEPGRCCKVAGKEIVTSSQACFKSSFPKPAAAGASIKPREEPKAVTLSQVWKAIRLVKWAAGSRLTPTSWAVSPYYHSPGAHAPGFMLSPAAQAQIEAFKMRYHRWERSTGDLPLEHQGFQRPLDANSQKSLLSLPGMSPILLTGNVK